MMKRTRTCLPRIRLLALVASALLANGRASAGEPGLTACLPDEPDSVQISWDSPCQDGTWLMDTELGCRMWDWHPAPGRYSPLDGRLQGWNQGRSWRRAMAGTWPAHRFEGSFVAGRRHGWGRYVWNETDWYEGLYEDNLPHGSGTAHIAGEVFVGQWQRGCFRQGNKVVAIAISRNACEAWLSSGL